MSVKKHGLYEKNKINYIPVRDIVPNVNQPRRLFDQESLRELASSIERYGVLQPLTVHRTGKVFELVSGERRLRASRLAGLETVPCLIMDVSESDSAVLALVENLHRRDLDFIEEAEGLHKLIAEHHMSQEEAARRVGISQSAVANKLRVLKLPGELLYIIREAGLTERHARALLRLEDNDRRIEALQTIITGGLNVAKSEDLIDRMLKENMPKPAVEEAPPKPVYVLKDVRLFLNTLSRGVAMMKQSGINAKCDKDETQSDIVLTIKIPKATALR